ncbi:MAG: FAD:protein FMN transferase [Phocaeicola sp.]|uniref:FAD:protein FMN transferase n=1 Tax=Phocaeicola TaxID=909656 RepID=UPI00234F65C6|nr:FAD:protein FMN transferase [Phocaeicola oris]MCE2616047.1 FAD:protein FMN transferase [Phocaeicola oris]
MNTIFSYSDYHESSQLFYGLLMNVMGTRLDAILLGKDKNKSIICWNSIEQEIIRLSKIFNKFDENSELFFINHRAFSDPQKISDELWDILKECQHHHKLTEGYFDITIGHFNSLIFDDEHKAISFMKENMEIDLGAFGKGYALDKIRKILIDNGFSSSLINFGNSSVLGLGTHPYGNCWPIGISNPFNSKKQIGVVELNNSTMSTSGNMPSHKKHIINPHTGAYNEQRKLVTVRAVSPIEAEIISTTLMVLPLEMEEKVLSNYHIDKYWKYNL